MSLELPKGVVEKIEKKDILLIVSPFVLIILIYFLPEKIQESLALSYENPRLINLLTSAFVHGGRSHLIGNLTAYLLFVIPIFLMSIIAREKKKFYLVFSLFVLVFPFILSSINLYFIDAETSRGFSGVDSAFLGFMPIISFHLLRKKVCENLKKTFPVSFLFFAFSLVVFTYVDALIEKVLTSGVILLLAVFFLWWSTKDIDFKKFLKTVKDNPETYWHFWIGMMGILIFIVGVISIFPAEIVSGESTVNIVSHYFGLVLGFLIPYFSFQVERLT